MTKLAPNDRIVEQAIEVPTPLVTNKTFEEKTHNASKTLVEKFDIVDQSNWPWRASFSVLDRGVNIVSKDVWPRQKSLCVSVVTALTG